MATSPDSISSPAGPLDVSNLVSQLIAEESKSQLAPLVRKAEDLDALVSAYDALRDVLGAYQKALDGLANSHFNAHQSRSCDDTGVLAGVVSDFVHAFNTMTMALAGLARQTPSPPADQAGDTPVQDLVGQLRAIMLAAAGLHENRSVVGIGISLREDDTLTVDGNGLEKALGGRPEGLVAAFFCDQDGLVPRTQSLLDRVLGEDGLLAGKTRALQIRLKAVCDQQAATRQRLASLRDSYIRQFNRLNLTLEKMQASQDPPGHQLARPRKP